MKAKLENTKANLPLLPPEQLNVNGVYFSNENHLIKILKIDETKKEYIFLDISEGFKQIVKFHRHNLVQKIR